MVGKNFRKKRSSVPWYDRVLIFLITETFIFEVLLSVIAVIASFVFWNK